MTWARRSVVNGVVALAAAAALSSCATYYGIEATLPAPVSETASALTSAVHNIADFSVIEDATTITDSATLRYIGLQGVAAATGRVVKTLPKFAIRLQPDGASSMLSVTSVGGDQYAKLVIAATEQELLHRSLVRLDSNNSAPPGALPFKSQFLHQILNFVTPAAGMFYAQKGNPYTSPTAFLEACMAAVGDAGGMYLMASSIGKTFVQHPQRDRQYKFVVGLVISSLLRFTYGNIGFLQIDQYNNLADSPYNLESSFVDQRIASMAISVRFP